ncbi:hypothetical protein Tco_0705446 [Tanacetum coccineum]|uniref:Reverse transcriptase domain-containing protein n=1 Tax=Tanacetum coccineum TaxID=301880 RepID=A0ABQ4Y5H1_9ASTR
MVNNSCKDSFKRFTDELALVCSPSSENAKDEKEKQEVKNLAELTAKHQTRITPCLKNFKVICKESIFHSNKTPQVSSVFAITSTLPSIEPKDSLIMGDEHLSTFSVEEIVLEDIECKDSYDSNLDESTFLVTPLSNSNKDECLAPGDDIEFLLHHDPILYDAQIDEAECFDPGGDNDEIDAFLAIEVPTYIEEGYYDSEGDVLYLESLLSDDTTHNLSPKVFFNHEPQHIENAIRIRDTFYPKSDPLHHEFAGSVIMIPPGIVREHEDYISRMSLLCGNSSS